MKRYWPLFVIGLLLLIGAGERSPWLNGLMQSDADCGGFSLTNANTFRGLHFIDAATGLPITGGGDTFWGTNSAAGGITNVMGPGVFVITGDGVSTVSGFTAGQFIGDGSQLTGITADSLNSANDYSAVNFNSSGYFQAGSGAAFVNADGSASFANGGATVNSSGSISINSESIPLISLVSDGSASFANGTCTIDGSGNVTAPNFLGNASTATLATTASLASTADFANQAGEVVVGITNQWRNDATNTAISYSTAATNAYFPAKVTSGITNQWRTDATNTANALILLATNASQSASLTASAAQVLAATNASQSASLTAANAAILTATNASQTAEIAARNTAILNATNASQTASLAAAQAQGYITKFAFQFCGSTARPQLAALTNFYNPFNTETNPIIADTAATTRVPCTRTMTITNLYVVLSGNLGTAHTNWVDIYTNGTIANIRTAIGGASDTSGSDTTHGFTVVAGTQIGIRCGLQTSATAAAVAWCFEGIVATSP